MCPAEWGAFLCATPLAAQEADQTVQVQEQDLVSAISKLSAQLGVEIMLADDVEPKMTVRSVSGQLAPAKALSLLLNGTGLSYRQTSAARYEVTRLPSTAEGDVRLGSLRVEGAGDGNPLAYQFGGQNADPLASGTSRFDRDAIAIRAPGTGDVNQMLRLLPSVQFSNSQGIASAHELQDLRPEFISISGGSPYENNFLVDGVGVNSRQDMFGGTEGSYNAGHVSIVAATSPQSFWMDANLVGDITVHDSNVSARFGGFTGGVVEVNTRSPKSSFGISGYVAKSSDGMARFLMSDATRDALNGADVAKPEFTKERFGITVDVPISDDFRLLAAYNRSRADVINARSSSYAHLGAYGQKSISDNFMIKAEYDASSDIVVKAQLSYSPYESEFQSPSSLESLIVTKGGGLTGQLSVDGKSGDANWQVEISHAYSDSSRDGPAGTYNISTLAPGMDWCSTGSTCTFGSVGPIDQTQNDTVVKAHWEQPLGNGILSFGGEYSHIVAAKRRDEAVNLHLNAVISPDTICLVDEGRACVDGAYALRQRNVLPVMDVKAVVNAVAAYAEYQTDVLGFMVRAGLRYDYEDFLGNHNVAPRLSISRDVLGKVNLTFGANRYYGRSFLGHALRDQYGAMRTYTRTATMVDGAPTWGDTWVLNSHTESSRYGSSDLDTPYNDELTLALTAPVPVLGGEFRARALLRRSRDQFSSILAYTEEFIKDTGQTATRSVYELSNDGRRDYRSLTLEYLRQFGANHSLSLNANFSRTKANNISYFDIADDLENDGVMVVYKGQIVPVLEATSANQIGNYGNPLVVNADLSSRLWDGRLRTNVNMRYRGTFSRVEDTDINQTIDGKRYDVYDVVDYKPGVEFNLGADVDVLKSQYGTATLELRVNNLLNRVPFSTYSSTSQPWQMGRNIWITARLTH